MKSSGLVAAALVLAGCGHTGIQPLSAHDAATNAAIAQAVNEGLPGISEDGPTGPNQTITVPAQPLRAPAAPTSGNEATLSVSPAETLPAVKAFVQSAQHTLWIEMFEFGGSYGKQLIPLVIERAKAGVQVKLMVDQAGSGSKSKGMKPFEKDLKAAGVELHYYPARLRRDGSLWRFNITHRKLLLADNQVAMAGGTNFGTTFDTTTQDLMVRWRGPVVADLYREFTTEWKFVTGASLPVPPAPAPVGNVNAQVAVTSVPEGRFEIRNAVFDKIDHAQSEIDIEQQYIWEDNLDDHLLGALKRGVKVRVMVPGGTKEQALLAALNDDTVKLLVENGAEARCFYNQAAPVAHLHAKFFGVDHQWVATGSCNGDARSLFDHQELDVFSDSPSFINDVTSRLFEHDWAVNSVPWTKHDVPWYERKFRNLLELVDYLF